MESLEGLSAWAAMLKNLVEPLPKVEGEFKPLLAPPSPFVLGALKDDRKQEEKEYVEAFKKILKMAKDGRSDAEERWNRAKAAYLCTYDFGYKSPHQAKAYIPRLTRNVDVVAQYLRRMLVDNQQFFTVQTISSKLEDLAAAAVIQKMVAYLMEQNELSEKFTQLAKMGLLYGLIVAKIYALPEKITHVTIGDDGKVKTIERTAMRVKVDVIPPWQIYLDPTGLNKFVIHKVYVERSDLEDFVEMGLLNRDAVNTLLALGEGHRVKGAEKVHTPSLRPTYILFEYWGDWWDGEGKLLHRNIWAIFGGVVGLDGEELPDFVLLRGPMPNPYWHQKPPFVWSSVSPEPTSAVYPHSLADFMVDMQREYTRLFNAMLDGAIFDAINIYEVNEYLVEDPKELSDLFPGKVIRKRLEGGDVISVKQLGKMPTAAAFIVQLIERYLLEGFGVTETVLGYMASRGRPTATEVVTARSHAFSVIEEMGRMLEGNFLEPLLERVFQLAMQILPELGDEQMLQALGDMSPTMERLMALPPEEREALARGGYKFRVRGMSMQLTKAQELARINEFIQIAASIPMFAQKINWDALLRKILENYGWSPDEILIQQQLPQQVGAQPVNAPQFGAPFPIPMAEALQMPISEAQLQATGSTIEPGSMEDISGVG